MLYLQLYLNRMSLHFNSYLPDSSRILKVLWVVLCMACGIVSQAQKKSEPSRFGLSVLAGLNLAQIDGDNYRGYDKAGFIGGLRGTARLSEAFQFRVELLYSQKGSKFESISATGQGNKEREIALDYAEIPVMVGWHVNHKGGRPAVWLSTGVSIARRLGSEIKGSGTPSEREFDFAEIEDYFKGTDINAVFGIQVDAAEFLGFEFRFTTAMNKFYENPDPPSGGPTDRETVSFLRNYNLSLLAMYHF